MSPTVISEPGQECAVLDSETAWMLTNLAFAHAAAAPASTLQHKLSNTTYGITLSRHFVCPGLETDFEVTLKHQRVLGRHFSITVRLTSRRLRLPYVAP